MRITPYEADFECPKGHTFTARVGMLSPADAVTCPQCYQEWIEANVPKARRVSEPRQAPENFYPTYD